MIEKRIQRDLVTWLQTSPIMSVIRSNGKFHDSVRLRFFFFLLSKTMWCYSYIPITYFIKVVQHDICYFLSLKHILLLVVHYDICYLLSLRLHFIWLDDHEPYLVVDQYIEQYTISTLSLSQILSLIYCYLCIYFSCSIFYVFPFWDN